MAHQEDGRWVHYVNDQIGTPERLLENGGDVACELRRSAWGQTEVLPGAKASTPIRFQGQYADEETGLCYNRWRYFEADAGRFTSGDPIGLAGGCNEFDIGPNTFRWSDPLGLAKRGPKKWPDGPHNQTIQRRIEELKEELGPDWKHTHGGSEKEEVIPTPQSATGRSCRRPDITFTNRKDPRKKHRENVGKKRGKRSKRPDKPITREEQALDDLAGATGTRPEFTAYN